MRPAPPGLEPIASAIDPLYAVRLPNASRATTRGAGTSVTPGVPPAGCTEKASTDGAAGVTEKPPEVACGSTPEEATSVYPTPILSRVRSPNVAMPPTAATVSVPPSTLVPPLVPMAIVTFPLNEVAVSPPAVRTVTTTAGAIATPATTLDGCAVTASWVAVPATEVAPNATGLPVSPDALAVSDWAPTVGPRTHAELARPAASVATIDAVGDPPDPAANVTATPATGTLSTARARTTTFCPSAAPATPVWPLPLTSSSVEARSATVTSAVSAGPVSNDAITCAVPRLARATPTPDSFTVTIDVSVLTNRTGVPAITLFSTSKACALNVSGSPSNAFTTLGVISTRVASKPVPM